MFFNPLTRYLHDQWIRRHVANSRNSRKRAFLAPVQVRAGRAIRCKTSIWPLGWRESRRNSGPAHLRQRVVLTPVGAREQGGEGDLRGRESTPRVRRSGLHDLGRGWFWYHYTLGNLRRPLYRQFFDMYRQAFLFHSSRCMTTQSWVSFCFP